VDPIILFFAAMAFTAGTVNAAFGVGGGIMIIACLPGRVIPSAIVPLHGLSILVNNLCRAALDWKCIRWHIVWQFMIGAVIGMLLALPILNKIPVERIPLLVGISILILIWLPRFSIGNLLPAPYFCCGLLQTFLAMFIGATGPLVMLFFLDRGFTRDEIIAHNAILNVSADLVKMAGFLSMGFPYADFLPEIAALAGGMTAGAFAGKRLRGCFSPHVFTIIIKLLITGLALKMIVSNLL